VEAEIAEAVAVDDVKAEALRVLEEALADSRIFLEEVVMTAVEALVAQDVKAEAATESVDLNYTYIKKPEREFRLFYAINFLVLA
jgi:hypothetical protein